MRPCWRAAAAALTWIRWNAARRQQDALRCVPRTATGVRQVNENNLRDLLTQLHTRLGSAQSLDAEDQRLLGTVLRDIEKVLAASDDVQPSSSSILETLAVKFEADHPALAETLRRLVDALAKAGI
jgi:ABC-type transporter Mla subunit MlaD